MSKDETESLGIPEAVKAECNYDLKQLITNFDLNSFLEAVGRPDLKDGLAKWDEVVEAEIVKLPDNSMQVRAAILKTLTEATWYIEQDQYEKAISALYDASDNAYQQSVMEGFEDFEEVSDKIDEIAKKIKTLIPES